MDFHIADGFTASLARPTGDERKAVKTEVFDRQMPPLSLGVRLHKLDRARAANSCSVRIGMDSCLLVSKADSSLLPCSTLVSTSMKIGHPTLTFHGRAMRCGFRAMLDSP